MKRWEVTLRWICETTHTVEADNEDDAVDSAGSAVTDAELAAGCEFSGDADVQEVS